MRKLPWGSGHTKYKPILNPLKVETTTTSATRRFTSPLAQLVFPVDIKNPSLPLSILLRQQNTTATASETAPSPLVSSSSASLGIRDLVQEVQQVDKQRYTYDIPKWLHGVVRGRRGNGLLALMDEDAVELDNADAESLVSFEDSGRSLDLVSYLSECEV
jgi:hypothetical protein